MGKRLTSGLLIVGILGVLLIYFFTVVDLPKRIYTPSQQEFLSFNRGRVISQLAPTMEFAAPAGSTDLPMMPSGESRVRATLQARYEEQEGVSVTIFDLEFSGLYQLTGALENPTRVDLFFPFPDNLQTLHDVRFLVNGVEPRDASYTTRGITWRTTLDPGETKRLEVSYKADGAYSFAYGLSRDQRANIDVEINVSGLSGSTLAESSLPTTDITPAADGDVFEWKYTGLIPNRDIAISLPSKLSFAQRIGQLQDDFQALAGIAPFLVALFIVCLAGLFFLKGLRFGLEGYLLAGFGMALFYPSLTFISGLIGLLPAAIVSLAVVSALLWTFLGLAVGWSKSWQPVGMLLLVILGFFSLGMLTPWRGLMLTSGGLLLLGTFMWAYARRPAPPGSMPGSTPQMAASKSKLKAGRTGKSESLAAASKGSGASFCLYCGHALADSHKFCPSCGEDARAIRRCSHCGHRQYAPPEAKPVHCVECGHVVS